ncbi:hypothetical protein HGP14_09680 [Rhizobium sp. P32RR-XVIII]|uniref:hypothetical protein n=1 Tax=Rhizobium sp. P32RR-XVIII TaxID=2726738 RepID=UPI001456AAF1|nr:hypothetical protein [Rhizobium sp. P32RR-XVIII]NLS03626.1 hypothetical protein [Rhizobium sp. P32RR-XVIII]
MSAPDWPSTLPQSFLRDGYAEEGADNLIVSEMSVGPAKMRRRTTANVRKISGGIRVTDDQFATLRSFVSDTIADRAMPFIFPDPHGGADLLVRMTSTYKVATLGLEWRVDIELEVLP